MQVKRIAVLGLWLLATACQSIDVGVETPATLPAEPSASAPATTATAAPSPATATTSPQPTAHPLAGLVYTIGAGNGLWLIGADGVPRLLTDQHYPTLSPDQSRVLYAIGYEGDIWLKEVPDGLGLNLTNTPDRDENLFWWWPANPSLVVFSSRTEAEGPFASTLGLMNVDGSNYRLLEGTSPSLSPPALSPDGQSIAFDKSAEPWLYWITGGAQPLSMDQFGLGFDKATYPTWSPDGTKLAWKVYGNGQSGVAIMDLPSGTATLLHVYTLQGGSEIWAELAWSPDGQWIAVVNQAERPDEQSSLWALRADGSEEHYLGYLASAPVWSPDSQALVFTQLPDHSSAFDAAQVKRVQVGQWQPVTLTLPGGAQVEQWVTPRP
jgi:Tol biopolymer transport system component